MAAKVLKQPHPQANLFGWLASLKVGLVLLVLLTVASIVATMIDPLQRAQQLVYFTWWFKLLLLLLAVNISCATWRTITLKILAQRHLRPMRQPEFYRVAPLREEIPFRGTAAEVAAAFRARGFKVACDAEFGHARRGLVSRWGAPVSHLGIVIVLAGGFLSPFFMVDGYVRLAEGQTTDRVALRGEESGQLPLDFQVRADDFEVTYFPQTQMPASFTSTVSVLRDGKWIKTGPVEVNQSLKFGGLKFHQTSYNEQPGLTRHQVLLTHPEQAPDGIRFQLSPGQTRRVPGREDLDIALHSHAPLHWVLAGPEGQLAEGQIDSAGKPVTVRAERFEPDFVIGQNREISSRSSQLNNPALQIIQFEGSMEIARQWLFGREDMRAMSHGGGGPYDLELVDVISEGEDQRFVVRALDHDSGAEYNRIELRLGEQGQLGAQSPEPELAVADADGWKLKVEERVPAYSTDLSVTRNPLIPFIYTGCALMLVGLVVAFFVKLRDVWFQLDARRGRLHVVASYRHPHQEFDPLVKGIVKKLRQTETIAAPVGDTRPEGSREVVPA